MSEVILNNPFNGEEIASYKNLSSQEIEASLAKLASGQSELKTKPYFERADVLEKLAALVQSQHEELAQLITKETGKTIRDSRVEITRTISTLKFSSLEARKVVGEVLDSDVMPPQRSKMGIVKYFPLGTVLVITPFNFPLNIAAHKIGPAYAAGNTIYFKPSPQNYLSSRAFADLCWQSGMTENELQFCPTNNEDMGRVITDSRIQCVNFTGSVRVGKLISQQCGLKRRIMELGGNDPLILCKDGDLDLAVNTVIDQRFGTAGQRCTAAKQLFVHSTRKEEFLQALVNRVEMLVVGDPTDEKTDVGPVVNVAGANHFSEVVAEAKESGAEVLAGGGAEGTLVQPTVLNKITNEMRVVREEVFAPVAPVREFNRVEEVISAVNAQDFGLQSGVFTNDLEIAKQLYEGFDVCAVAVNGGPGFRAEHFPFGGIKDSGIGQEGVAYALREMSFRKTLIL